ncbi:MAG: hypothetical protein Q4D34_00855 [Eggerthellaceae bacterium]|nr:hypothetical protein [Eggerthellaceae bacterium]
MFGKKRNNISQAGHIKSDTVGTSNEISFSVLDAAKLSMDGNSDQPSDAFKGFGKISLFTLPGKKKTITTPTKEQEIALPSSDAVSSEGASSPNYTLDFSPSSDAHPSFSAEQNTVIPGQVHVNQQTDSRISVEAEVARRKAKRKTRKILTIVSVCVAVVVLVVLAGFLYQQFSAQKQSVTQQINTALKKIEQADQSLVKMDTVLSNPITEASFENIDALFAELDESSKALDEATLIVNRLLSEKYIAADDETANYASAAIASRKTMLESGRALLEKAYETEQAVSLVSSASDQIFVADSLARDAARLVSGDLTEEKMLASYEKTRAAIDELASARQKLETASELSPSAGIGVYIEYIDLRIEAFEHGMASTQALIDEDTELAVQENDAYTEADARAATFASQFPEDWLEPIRTAFDEESKPLIAEYESARTDAGVTDSFLRNYLGTEVK